MTLLPPRPNHSASHPAAQASAPAAPGETERDHVANALQMLALSPAGEGLDLDALTRRLRLALHDIDARLERERAARVQSLHAMGAAVDIVARCSSPRSCPTCARREAATVGAMLRVERVEIDADRLASYGYARCANDKCLGGIVPLGERCAWCGTVAK